MPCAAPPTLPETWTATSIFSDAPLRPQALSPLRAHWSPCNAGRLCPPCYAFPRWLSSTPAPLNPALPADDAVDDLKRTRFGSMPGSSFGSDYRARKRPHLPGALKAQAGLFGGPAGEPAGQSAALSAMEMGWSGRRRVPACDCWLPGCCGHARPAH